MLEVAKSHGAEVIVDEVVDIKTVRGSVSSALLRSGGRISTPVVVNAAGPMSQQLAHLVGVELPMHASLHHKVSFRDHLGAFPRDAPMLLWTDPITIDWSEEERSALAAEGFDELLGEIATPVFGRPEGGTDSPFFEALWNYRPVVRDRPTWPRARSRLHVPRGGHAGNGRNGAFSDPVPRSAALLGCRWRICHEDSGEPSSDRPGGP